MLIHIDNRTFDDAYIQPGSWILDIGCKGFGLAEWAMCRGINVIACDPDREIVPPEHPNLFFERVAVLPEDDRRASAWYAVVLNGQPNTINPAGFHLGKEFYLVPCARISELMAKYGVTRFALIKLNCEGSEYRILKALPPGCCVQASAAFHDCLGLNPYPDDPDRYYRELWAAQPDMRTVRHERSIQESLPGNVTPDYWDSLFVFDKEIDQMQTPEGAVLCDVCKRELSPKEQVMFLPNGTLYSGPIGPGLAVCAGCSRTRFGLEIAREAQPNVA